MTVRQRIQILRLTAFVEGLSWLALLGAMLYRYFTGDHDPVAITGRIHGGLFCLFCLVLFMAWTEARWTVKFTGLIFLSAIIPLGFLVADPRLKRKLPGKEPQDQLS